MFSLMQRFAQTLTRQGRNEALGSFLGEVWNVIYEGY